MGNIDKLRELVAAASARVSQDTVLKWIEYIIYRIKHTNRRPLQDIDYTGHLCWCFAHDHKESMSKKTYKLLWAIQSYTSIVGWRGWADSKEQYLGEVRGITLIKGCKYYKLASAAKNMVEVIALKEEIRENDPIRAMDKFFRGVLLPLT